jgi:hypothetical protein
MQIEPMRKDERPMVVVSMESVCGTQRPPQSAAQVTKKKAILENRKHWSIATRSKQFNEAESMKINV